MKSKIIAVVIVLGLLIPGTVKADELGLGFKIGDPTGLSAKIWKSPTNSINLALAYDTGVNDRVTLVGDYAFYSYSLFNPESGNVEIPLYYGIGAIASFGDTGYIGARLPAGIDFLFAEPTFDISLEIAPTLYVVPDTDFGVYGGLGIHYTF